MEINKKFKMIGIGVGAVLAISTITGGVLVYASYVNQSYIGEEKAGDIALEHAGVSESEVSFTQSKFDYDDGVAEYEVDFYIGTTEYDYEIDAVTGEVRSYDVDTKNIVNNTMSQAEVTQANQTYIGEEKAKTLALEHAGVSESEVSFTQSKFDYDDGVAEYEVDFYIGTTEYDYEIDAVTGEVRSYDVDTKNIVNNTMSQAEVTQANQTYIGEEKAKTLALEHAGVSESEVSFTQSKFDYDDGVAEYEVDFYIGTTEYDYEIDAVTGEVRSYDVDTKNNTTSQAVVSSSDTSQYITVEEAKNIALQDANVNVADASYLKCEFDYDDGRAEYEVEWKVGRVEYEYTISAVDGTIWERDIEQDD